MGGKFGLTLLTRGERATSQPPVDTSKESSGMTRAPVPLLTVALLLAACAAPPPSAQPNDPFEASNRAAFDANLRLTGAGDADRPPRRENAFRNAVGNVGDNLGIPGRVVNDLLQLRPERAVQNTLRFAINSTIGLGGIFNPAGHIGLHGRATDFGETLHRWGVGEGAYMVLPLLGPSTERDTLGLAVDLVIDPLRFVLPPRELTATTVLRGAGRVARAIEYSDILDANVIDTADPYAQARLLYLQTRRYHLGVETDEEFIDPYADF